MTRQLLSAILKLYRPASARSGQAEDGLGTRDEIGAATPRGARTIGRIVDAAARLFSREGYEGATLNAVARAAGVSKGLLHYHFESKEQLLLEAQRATFRRIHEEFQERFRQGDRGLEAALEGLDALWNAIREMRAWAPFMVENMALYSRLGPVRSPAEVFYDESMELLEQGITEVFAQDRLMLPAYRLAWVVRAGLHGLVIELAYARSPSDLHRVDRIYHDMRDLFARGALAPDTRRPTEDA